MKYIHKHLPLTLLCIMTSSYSMAPKTKALSSLVLLQQKINQNPNLLLNASIIQEMLELRTPELKIFLAKPENAPAIEQFSIQSDSSKFLEVLEGNPLLLENESVIKRLLSLTEFDIIRFASNPKNSHIVAILKKRLNYTSLLRLFGKELGVSYPIENKSSTTISAPTTQHTNQTNLSSSSKISMPDRQSMASSIALPKKKVRHKKSEPRATSSIETAIALPNPNQTDFIAMAHKEVNKLPHAEKAFISQKEKEFLIKNIELDPEYNTYIQQLPFCTPTQKIDLIHEKILPRIEEAMGQRAKDHSVRTAFDEIGKTDAQIEVEVIQEISGFFAQAGKEAGQAFAHKFLHPIETIKGMTIDAAKMIWTISKYGTAESIDLLPEQLADGLAQKFESESYQHLDSHRLIDSLRATKAEGRLQLALLKYEIMKNPDQASKMIGTLATDMVIAQLTTLGGGWAIQSVPPRIGQLRTWLHTTKEGKNLSNFFQMYQGQSLKLMPHAFAIVQGESSLFKLEHFLSSIPEGAVLGFNPQLFALFSSAHMLAIPLSERTQHEDESQKFSGATLGLLSNLGALSADRATRPLQVKNQTTTSATHSLNNYGYIASSSSANIKTQPNSDSKSILGFTLSATISKQAAIRAPLQFFKSWRTAEKTVHERFEYLKAQDQAIARDPNRLQSQQQFLRRTHACFIQALNAKTYSERSIALLQLNQLSIDKLSGRVGLYFEKTVDAINAIYFDANGELKHISSTEQQAAISIYTDYLKAISSTKKEYVTYLHEAYKSGLIGKEIGIKAKNESFTQPSDETWLETLRECIAQTFKTAPQMRILHDKIIHNAHNKLLTQMITIFKNNAEVTAHTDYRAAWQAIANKVASIRANKNIPERYVKAIDALYKKYHRATFGKEVAVGSVAMHKAFVQDPKWSTLSEKAKRAILLDANRYQTCSQALAVRYAKCKQIARFLEISEHSKLWPLTYDLVDSVSNTNHINAAEIIDTLNSLKNKLPKAERNNFIQLFERTYNQANVKTALQLSQENFQRSLRYLRQAEETTLPALSALYTDMSYLQAMSEDCRDLQLLRKYTFSSLTQTAKQDYSQMQILKLVKHTSYILRSRGNDSHYTQATAQYLMRLAGAAQRAHAMGLYTDAIALAQMPAKLLNISGIEQLETALSEQGPQTVVQRLVNDTSDNALAKLNQYSNWLATLQESADIPVALSPTQVIYPAQAIAQEQTNELQKLSNIVQSRIAKLDIENSSAMLQAYARISQMISYGHQLPNAEDKKIVITQVNEFLKSLYMITTMHNVQPTTSSAEALLRALHTQANDVEKKINFLLTKTQIDSAMYGKYQPNTHALLGINFANDFLTQAQANAIASRQESLVIYDEDGIASMIALADIELMINNPNMSVSYQVVLLGQSIDEGSWKELNTTDIEEIKKLQEGDIYFQATHKITAQEKAVIEAERNHQPPLNNRPPKKDDEKDEMDKLVDELNGMLKNAKPNWKKMSELLKEQGIDISPEELEAIFKPETMDYDHGFRPDPQFKYDPKTGLYKAHMSGHHLDKGICKVEYGPETTLPGGAIQRDVTFQGLFKKDNCYFPNHWTEKDVMKAVIEVLSNPKVAEMQGSRLIIEGVFMDVEIRVLLDKAKFIKSTYPIKLKL